MNLNYYNYTLNGISHEVQITNQLKFKNEPLPQKILLSNKYFIKIINDLFDYLSIEYIPIKNTLLGHKIFNGVHIFDDEIEFMIEKNNFKKILKERHYLHENNIYFSFIDNLYIKLRMNLFDSYYSEINIYLFENNNNIITFEDQYKNKYTSNFYDIFPIQKKKYEEFEISSPHKIDNVLEQQHINLNYIELVSYRLQVEEFMYENIGIIKLIIYIFYIKMLINF